jgi:hypothetical protein
MGSSLISQGLALQAASAKRSIPFHIKHTDPAGTVTEYDALFRNSIDAIKDCVAVFGLGKIKVVRSKCPPNR